MRTINWKRIYEQEASKLIGAAYRYVNDHKQAEDLVQNAFLIAIQKADTFKGSGAFEAWLRRIVINECLMFLRANKHNIIDPKSRIAENIEDYAAETDDTEDNNALKKVEKAEFTIEELMETANLLSEHHRLVFYLYVIDHFSHKEIAEKLHISEGTSKSNLNRARKKLQKLLSQKAMEKKNPCISSDNCSPQQNSKRHLTSASTHRNRLFATIWFLALLGNTYRVDAMYRRAFANFKLPPPTPSETLQQGLQMSTGSVGISNTSMALLLGSLSVCGAGSTYLFLRPKPISEHKTEIRMETNKPVIAADTIASEIFADSNSHIKKPKEEIRKPESKRKKIEEKSKTENKNIKEENIKKAEPVIIKKVTVIDTIYED